MKIGDVRLGSAPRLRYFLITLVDFLNIELARMVTRGSQHLSPWIMFID